MIFVIVLMTSVILNVNFERWEGIWWTPNKIFGS